LIAGISFMNNKDDIGSALQNQNKNDVIFPGLEFKKSDLEVKENYFNTRLVVEEKLKVLSNKMRN
jgi:hypothetical protein